MHVCATTCVCPVPAEAKENRVTGTRVTHDYLLLYGCWERMLSLLQEQQVLLPAEPPLQPTDWSSAYIW